MTAHERKAIRFGFYSDEALLRKLADERIALARFGDGEIAILLNRGAPAFQSFDPDLQARLRDIIRSDHPNVLIGIPKYFNDTDRLHFYSKPYWDAYIRDNLDFIRTLDTDRMYADTGVTRPYIDLADKSGCGAAFDRFKSIWKDKRVLIVEGKKSRFGVDNDLLRDARAVHRILCPEKNAFRAYDAIKNETLRAADAHDVILAALGPTATVLCYDLGIMGRKAIDIGHLDIEYEWYLKKSVWKVQINNKYVNEARNPYIETNRPERSYYESIIAEIEIDAG